MILMPGNNTGFVTGYLYGKHPKNFGLLMSPDGWREPRLSVPYALDNGCFKRWDKPGFFDMLSKALNAHPPLWVCVPDAVADAETTIRRWHKYSCEIASSGFKLAFVVQDGMEPQDVPAQCTCIFVGGSTKWKLKNAHRFKTDKLLHIGRVNTLKRVLWAKDIGADSVDGTGWLRGRGKQYNDLLACFNDGLL